MHTLYNQFVYFAFFQSLLLLIVLLFSKKNRKNVNPFLAILVATLFLGLSGRVLYAAGVFGGNWRLNSASEWAAMLFGTTLYLFTKSSLQNRRPKRYEFLHFAPSMGYMIFILVYFVLASPEIISERIASGELKRAIWACHALGLGVNITYWGMSLGVLVRFRESLKNEVSFALETTFFKYLHIVMGIGFLIWLTLYTISLFGYDMIERNARPTIWLAMAFVVLFIAFYGMVYPEVYRLKTVEKIQKYAQSKLTIADLELMKNRLEQLMEERKPYLNSKLLKAELAEMLGTSNPELARLLNENIGMNFFEYVNYYRIREFVALAKTEKAQQLTFFGLAQEAGFNSKTTFNKSFKKLMGVSPTEYFNNQNDTL